MQPSPKHTQQNQDGELINAIVEDIERKQIEIIMLKKEVD